MNAAPSPEREWFDRALDVPIGARSAFLAQACPDPDVRARVQALPHAHDRAGERCLAQSAGELAAAAFGRAGRRLLAYQITRETGRGGMGAVDLAARVDDEFQKQVAIKIVAAPRLRLFLRVGEAVQFAHNNLVIHRDLKPGNILVTADGQPRLLDFGIAALVTSEDAATATRTVAAMTPEYASPEQMRGERVTAASDVYSLGMILYELLAGAAGHDFSGKRPDEVFRLVTDVEPLRPSLAASRRGDAASSRRLRGDLGATVLMELRKEPHRRYTSVAVLSDDLQQYLDGKPVTARGEAVAYRARNFVRRHRIVVAAAAAFALALVGGIRVDGP